MRFPPTVLPVSYVDGFLIAQLISFPNVLMHCHVLMQGKMSRTWILYNKPEEPNVVHAGLLLALGLHGHLRVLTITDIYQYYSQVVYFF